MKIGRNERGFTLIELMVVLIIIGILAAIAIPVMSKQTDKAKIKRAVSELKSMKTAVDLWINDPAQNTGSLKAPKAIDGTEDDDAINKVLRDGGVDINVKDPWNNPYHYIAGADGKKAVIEGDPGIKYIILSYGPDGKYGGGDDITVTDVNSPQENQHTDDDDTPEVDGGDVKDVEVTPEA